MADYSFFKIVHKSLALCLYYCPAKNNIIPSILQAFDLLYNGIFKLNTFCCSDLYFVHRKGLLLFSIALKYKCNVVCVNDLSPVVQNLDNTVHRINHYPVDNTIIGSLSSDVFERHTSTRSEVFSLLTCLDDIKFVFLSFFTVMEAI